jgi:hypothetical protein
MIGEDMRSAQTEIIQEIIARKESDRKLLNLEDMSPESTMSQP